MTAETRVMLRYMLYLTVAIMVVWVYTVAQSYKGRMDLVDSQRSGCERGKLDRRAQARAWSAHRTYINRVLDATSVQGDVKAAAVKARDTYDEVVPHLVERSKIDCREAFPSPSLMAF